VDGQDVTEPDGTANQPSEELAPAAAPTPPPPPFAPLPFEAAAPVPPPVPAPTPPQPEPLPYTPPPQAAPLPYTPPPPSAPLPYTPPQTAPPAAKPRRTGRPLLILVLIVVLLLVAVGGGAVLANASLSSTYSPDRAVTDYLAAQKRGDTSFMIANANYLKGDGSSSQYFDKNELDTMMSYAQNTDISNVKVSSIAVVDSNTRTVNVTMTWNGHQLQPAFTVHKDLTRVHYQFFNSWRIDIPFASIHITLPPNQPGAVSVDGSPLPSGATSDIQVIQGFHKVTMDATSLSDSASADADAIAGNATVVFPSKLSSAAMATAVSTVKSVFGVCDASKYIDCVNHTYLAPVKANTTFFITWPGYGDVTYTKYVFTLTSDPTANMNVVIEAGAGTLSVSGVCAYTMTVDGNRPYYFKGTWSGTLTASASSWGYNLSYNCVASKA
jgi:archaellum component FlaF (FlaF/FlaG flagellin family)